MKIGILTFHEGINHGGFFQAYSTYSYLLTKGYDVEIINYKNKSHWLAELNAVLRTKNPRVFFSKIRKILAFKKDQKKMNLGPFTTKVEKITTEYDVVIVGSDIVWNYEFDFLGKDPIYYGYGISAKKLLSYAPSFGSVDINNTIIPEYVINGLSRFEHISVRDENSQNIVKKACGKNAKLVLDPTFLIDTKGMETAISSSKPFILIYAYLLQDSDIEQINKFADRVNMEIISIGYYQPFADVNILDVGPFEWLSYFENASYILTSTFHGTIYALKYEKNFITSNNENIKNKTSTILNKLGLSNRLVNGDSDFDELYSVGVDYKEVNRLLTPLISDSKSYLLEAIEK